jgi:hypothetical protein
MAGKPLNAGTKVWLVTVDMGYGHQRAAYPLHSLAYKKVIDINNYEGMPESDKKIIEGLEKSYNAISKFKKVPIIGEPIYALYDRLQRIRPFDPNKDMSRPTFQTYFGAKVMRQRGWGKHLINKLAAEKPLPFLTTFFSPAHMADIHGYPGEIYCVLCDTDISRDWVAVKPKESRIKYFAPNERTFQRLQCYGVPKERIFLTGFPIPDELVGGPGAPIARADMAKRLVNLDPKGVVIGKQKKRLLKDLKLKAFPKVSGHPLTVMFAVGGAGAQGELGVQILETFAERIKAGKLRLILVAGIHQKVNALFLEAVKRLGLTSQLGKGVIVMHQPVKQRYFEEFNKLLRVTDVLWTKPSELSFYVGLGLPLLIAPNIGSQEQFNQAWLLEVGAGVIQPNARNLADWFDGEIEKGTFAKAAIQGFKNGYCEGAYNIAKIIKERHGKK